LTSVFAALSAAPGALKMRLKIERRGVGGGEEKERWKFGGEMMLFRWILLRGELTNSIRSFSAKKWPIAPDFAASY